MGITEVIWQVHLIIRIEMGRPGVSIWKRLATLYTVAYEGDYLLMDTEGLHLWIPSNDVGFTIVSHIVGGWLGEGACWMG
jgi:hypothetical protein